MLAFLWPNFAFACDRDRLTHERLNKNLKLAYETQNPVSDYDQSCSNEPCAGFVWRPNKRPAFVFAPIEPVQIYYRQTKRNIFPKHRKNCGCCPGHCLCTSVY